MFDINKINTYPEKFKEFCDKNFQIIKNTIGNSNINDFYVCSETYLFDTVFDILKNEKIKLIHATRLIDKNCIYEKGILNPKISEELTYIILKPIKDLVTKDKFTEIETKMKNKIKTDDKYAYVWFVLGSIEDINLNNGLYMLNKYGGELLEDIFSILNLRECYDKKISKLGNPYAITFKCKIEKLNINFIEEVISSMLFKYINKSNYKIFKQSYIKDSILSNQILNIEKLKN